MKKILIIGSVGAGKTTLKQRLKSESVKYDKTMVVEFFDDIIDTPGEYLDNRQFLKALIITSYEADIIGLVQDATSEQLNFNQGIASAFNKECIGIITKVDKVDEDKIDEAIEKLEFAGASNIYKLGFDIQDDLQELMLFLQGGKNE